METVNKKIAVISIIMALFTCLLVYLYIKKSTTVKPETVQYVDVYIAAKTLPARHKITDADIRQTRVVKDLLHPKAVQDRTEIVGKRLKERIIEGEQILRDRLVDEGSFIMSYNLPYGKRAVSINVNDQINVSNLVRPGDFVDVIASFEKEEEEEGDTKIIYPRITKIIIQNVEVLALGQDQTVQEGKIEEAPKTVTLAVTPEQAETLVYASEFGMLRLALRPLDDGSTVNTGGIIRSDITKDKGVKVMPK